MILASVEPESSLEAALTQPLELESEPYLQVQLTEQLAAVVPMEFAQEASVMPAERLTPVPNMPAYILGLLNKRSRIFWVIDLLQLLGFAPHTSIQQYSLVMVQVGNMPLGLVVPTVKGILRLNVDAIQPTSGTVPSHVTPYLQGCISSEKELLLVLDLKAIVHTVLQQDS